MSHRIAGLDPEWDPPAFKQTLQQLQSPTKPATSRSKTKHRACWVSSPHTEISMCARIYHLQLCKNYSSPEHITSSLPHAPTCCKMRSKPISHNFPSCMCETQGNGDLRYFSLHLEKRPEHACTDRLAAVYFSTGTWWWTQKRPSRAAGVMWS